MSRDTKQTLKFFHKEKISNFREINNAFHWSKYKKIRTTCNSNDVLDIYYRKKCKNLPIGGNIMEIISLISVKNKVALNYSICLSS